MDDVNPEGHIVDPFDDAAAADLLRDGETGDYITRDEAHEQSYRMAEYAAE